MSVKPKQVRFLVKGAIEGIGTRGHHMRAANYNLAKGRFEAAYPGKKVVILSCERPGEGEAHGNAA